MISLIKISDFDNYSESISKFKINFKNIGINY